MMDWRESDHPRDPRNGEFVDKPTGWVSTIARSMTGVPAYLTGSTDTPETRRYRSVMTAQFARAYEKTEPPEPIDPLSAIEGVFRSGVDPIEIERLRLNATQTYFRDWFRRRNFPDMTTEQMHEHLARQAKAIFGARQVATRTTPAGLAGILRAGRFRTVFDAGIKSRGLNNPSVRAKHEQGMWGYEPDSDPSVRPVYGYLAGDVRHAPKEGEALAQYGRIEVRLKDRVRSRTTAMFGDSLDMRHAGRPSQVDNPDGWAWTYANPGGLVTHHYSVGDRDPDDRSGYIEAQVHGGVSVDDIESVVFPSAPSPELKDLLAQAGIPWQVVKA